MSLFNMSEYVKMQNIFLCLEKFQTGILIIKQLNSDRFLYIWSYFCNFQNFNKTSFIKV